MNASELQAFADLSGKVDGLISKVEELTAQLAAATGAQVPDNTADIVTLANRAAAELAK